MTYSIALPRVPRLYPIPTPSRGKAGGVAGGLLAAVLSVAVAGSLMLDVSPAVEQNATAGIVARVAPDQGSVKQPNAQADGTFTASTKSGLFTLPASAAGTLVLTPHPSVDPVVLQLPGADPTSRAVRAHDGTVVYPASAPGVDLAVQVLQDEGIRVHAVVLSPNASREFAYDFGGDVVGMVEPSGGVTLNRSTAAGVESVGRLEPPWARDAVGRSVPTHYSVSGGIVSQHITPAPHHVYPLVADPFFIPLLGVVARFSAHALFRMAQRKISQEAVKRTILNGVRTRGNKPNTSVFTSGSGKSRIRVVVDDRNGTIITVTK